MGYTDGAGLHEFAHPSEVVIEPAVEADHHLDASPVDGFQHPIDATKIQIDRLFAEDLLPCSRSALNQIRVSIGAGADQNSIDPRVREYRIGSLVSFRDRQRACAARCCFVTDVGDRDDLCFGDTGGQMGRVQRADPSCTDDTDVDSILHRASSLLFGLKRPAVLTALGPS